MARVALGERSETYVILKTRNNVIASSLASQGRLQFDGEKKSYSFVLEMANFKRSVAFSYDNYSYVRDSDNCNQRALLTAF